MNVKLTPKQIAVLADVVRLKLLSTRQIGELHFDLAEKPETTAPANLMRKLKMAGCVKSAYTPLTSTETDTPTRPSAVWFVPPDSLKVIRRVLVEQGRASEWEAIEATAVTINKDQRFAEQSLRHEVGISDVLMALERQVRALPGFELVFALRTSPRHEDISTTIEIKKTRTVQDGKTKELREREFRQKTTVNPDLFFAIQYPDKTFGFFFGEYDNDTSNEAKFFEKLEGYHVYQSRGLFEPVARTFSERYALPIKDFSGASFRVVTIVNSKTNPTRRRNSLFSRSLLLPTNRFYNFATLDEWKRDPLGQVFLNKQTFAPLMDEYHRCIKPASPTIVSKWMDSKLDGLRKDSIAS